MKPELTEIDPEALAKITELQLTLSGTVTSIPLLIVTLSEAAGTPTGDQVVGVFHEPSATAVFCALTVMAVIIKMNTTVNVLYPCKIFLIPRIFKFKKGRNRLGLPQKKDTRVFARRLATGYI